MLKSGGAESQSRKLASNHFNSVSERMNSHESKQDALGTTNMKSMGDGVEATIDPDDTPTDSDMDEVIRASNLDKKTKKVTHRVTKNWNSKITSKLNNDGTAAEDVRAASTTGKR